MGWAAALLGSVMLCSAAPQIEEAAATGPDRERGFGIVRSLDGEPWAGAEVHLVHRPHNVVLDESVADRLVAVTDARGRFRIALLRGAAYGAWARSPDAGGDGTVRVTALVVAATARTPLELQEVEPVGERRLRLDVHPSWADQPTFRVLARSRALALWNHGEQGAEQEWLRRGDDGCYRLPVWWDSTLQVDVFCGGWLIRRLWVPPRSADGGDALLVRAVPKRWTRSVRLLAADRETPVAGAVAIPLPEPSGLELPRSDAEGRFEVMACDVAELGPREIAHYAVRAEGHVERSFVTLHCSNGILPSIDRELGPGYTVQGRLLLDGQPLSGVPIVVQSEIEQELFRRWDLLPDRVVHSDAEGRFEVVGRSTEAGTRLVAVLSPAQAARLTSAAEPRFERAVGAPLRAAISPLVVLETTPLVADPEGAPRDLGDLDLVELPCCELTVEGPDRQPAAAAAVLLGGRAEGDRARNFERSFRRAGCFTRLRADRHGRVAWVAHRPANLVVAAGLPGQGLGWARLPAGPARLTVQAERRHAIRVGVVGRSGRPVAGARASMTLAFDAPVGVGWVGGGAGRAGIDGDAEDEARLVVTSLLRNRLFGAGSRVTADDGFVRFLVPKDFVGSAWIDVVTSDGQRGQRQIALAGDHLADEWYELVID